MIKRYLFIYVGFFSFFNPASVLQQRYTKVKSVIIKEPPLSDVWGDTLCICRGD